MLTDARNTSDSVLQTVRGTTPWQYLGLGAGGRVPFDQLVPVALFFLFGGFLAKLGKAFEQIWKFGLSPVFRSA